eukprot:350415-Chlamydomonas_euryale.AAC.11
MRAFSISEPTRKFVGFFSSGRGPDHCKNRGHCKNRNSIVKGSQRLLQRSAGCTARRADVPC